MLVQRRSQAARLELGARLRARLGNRPPDRRHGAAGRLLRPADPDGGGPARPGHRRARRGLPGREPLRAARPRPRLRLERHDRDLRQRRHVRRGPVPATTSTTCTRASACAMEKLDRTNTWTPNALDSTPPGCETLTAYRTVHGIVYRARHASTASRSPSPARARPTSTRRTRRWASPHSTTRASCTTRSSFQQAASDINFAFNWSYIDSEHIAYYLSGWYPQRAPRHLARLPDPRHRPVRLAGLQPDLHTMPLLPFERAPERDRPATTSCPGTTSRRRGWAAADDNYAYGPIYRAQLIARPRRGARSRGEQDAHRQLVQVDGGARHAGHPRRAAAADPAAGRSASPSDPRCARRDRCSRLAARRRRTGATSTSDGKYDDRTTPRSR